LKTLFDEIYDKADDFIKGLKKPLVKKQVKRRLCASHDDAENKKLDAQTKLQDLRGKFNDFDVNNVLEQKQIIEENKTLQKMIAEEYKELFGAPIPKDE
jgi:type I restriction-modification system DNA methylase subunit